MLLNLMIRWLAGGIGIVSAIALPSGTLGGCDRALAQNIQPDTTLGVENSIRTRTINTPSLVIDQISGGARRGVNLFHSFREFSLPEARQTVVFLNPAGVQNILTRVTGANSSDIQGMVRVLGNANLFLLNPNGIILGPTARLDVRGSFVATTADTIQFGTVGDFSATAPKSPSALLVVQPSALWFNSRAAQAIQSQAVLTVRRDRSVVLVGGDVILTGGQIQAPGGRVELAAIAGSGSVELIRDGNQWQIAPISGVPLADITLTRGAQVESSPQGTVQLQGRQVALREGAQVGTVASDNEPGGNLTVRASDRVELTGTSTTGQTSGLFSSVESGTGTAGNILVIAPMVRLRDGARISASTFGAGQGGRVEIIADLIQLVGTSPRGVSSGVFAIAQTGTGSAGDLTLTTRQLSVLEGAQISTSTFGNSQGGGGNLTVNASEGLIVSGTSAEGQVRSGLLVGTTGAQSAGNLQIRTPQVRVENRAVISAGTGGTGRGGNVDIMAQQLTVRSGAEISAKSGGVGDAGNLAVLAEGVLLETGGILTAASAGQGQGGNVNVTAQQVTVRSGAEISAKSGGVGDAGNLAVLAEGVLLETGGILTAASVGQGRGGNVNVTAQQVTVRSGAEISVKSSGTRAAGSLMVQAGTLLLDTHGTLTAETASGDGGNIAVQISDRLWMRHGSQISTTAGTAQAGGNGGNIYISTPFLIAVPSENSDITANAFTGTGGNIQITAQGVFGIQFRPQSTAQSDITASSTFGSNGVVDINTLAADPSHGLVGLPTGLVDPTRQIAQGCGAHPGHTASRLVATGRGGIPLSPNDPWQPRSPILPWVTLGDSIAAEANLQESTLKTQHDSAFASDPASPAPIVEAQGWIVSDRGEVMLVAQPVNPSPHSALTLSLVSCDPSTR